MTFNPQQLAAIEAKEKDIVVVATAGSGKSSICGARIVRLVDALKIPPKGIVAVTFTVAAGKVLKDGLAEYGISIGYAGTLHSWLLREINRRHRSLGFKSTLTVLSEEDATALYHKLAESLKYTGTLRDLQDAMIAPPVRSLMKSKANVTAGAIRQYLKDRSLLTFDTILSYGQLIASQLTPDVLFYDEAQDMNQAQANIIQDCGAGQRFLCGDPNQAIFGFNQGSPEHMLRFAQTFKVYPLELNYRCPTNVCEAANRLAEQMDSKFRSLPSDDKPGQILYHGFDNDFQQDERVDSWLRYLLSHGVQDIAILCRLNQQADRWREKLTWAGFPIARTVTLIPPDWKKALAFARAAAAPDNPYAVAEWTRVLKGDEQAENFLSVAIAHAKHWSFDPSEGLTELSEESRAVLDAYGADPQERLMGALSHQFERTEQAGIHVLTCHKAKGQQWQAVVLPDFQDSIIPAARPTEEDKRLAFVAITRTKQFLYISSVGQPSRFLYDMGLVYPAMNL